MAKELPCIDKYEMVTPAGTLMSSDARSFTL